MRNMMDGTVTGQGAGTAAAISIKVSSQEIKEIDSIQQTITWYAGGGEHPGGGREKGAGGAGQARSKDPLKSTGQIQRHLK